MGPEVKEVPSVRAWRHVSCERESPRFRFVVVAVRFVCVGSGVVASSSSASASELVLSQSCRRPPPA
eukprot:1037243-Alexandrium_andersonii.AAC.1